MLKKNVAHRVTSIIRELEAVSVMEKDPAFSHCPIHVLYMGVTTKPVERVV